MSLCCDDLEVFKQRAGFAVAGLGRLAEHEERLAEGGRSGGALRFSPENTRAHFYRVPENLPYAPPGSGPDGWSGTISYFLSLDPETDLPPPARDAASCVARVAWEEGCSSGLGECTGADLQLEALRVLAWAAPRVEAVGGLLQALLVVCAGAGDAEGVLAMEEVCAEAGVELTGSARAAVEQARAKQ